MTHTEPPSSDLAAAAAAMAQLTSTLPSPPTGMMAIRSPSPPRVGTPGSRGTTPTWESPHSRAWRRPSPKIQQFMAEEGLLPQHFDMSSPRRACATPTPATPPSPRLPIQQAVMACSGHFCDQSFIVPLTGLDPVKHPFMVRVRYNLEPLRPRLSGRQPYLVALPCSRLKKLGSGVGLDVMEAWKSWLAKDCRCSPLVPLNGRAAGEVGISLDQPDLYGQQTILLSVVTIADLNSRQDWLAVGTPCFLKVSYPPDQRCLNRANDVGVQVQKRVSSRSSQAFPEVCEAEVQFGPGAMVDANAQTTILEYGDCDAQTNALPTIEERGAQASCDMEVAEVQASAEQRDAESQFGCTKEEDELREALERERGERLRESEAKDAALVSQEEQLLAQLERFKEEAQLQQEQQRLEMDAAVADKATLRAELEDHERSLQEREQQLRDLQEQLLQKEQATLELQQQIDQQQQERALEQQKAFAESAAIASELEGQLQQQRQEHEQQLRELEERCRQQEELASTLQLKLEEQQAPADGAPIASDLEVQLQQVREEHEQQLREAREQCRQQEELASSMQLKFEDKEKQLAEQQQRAQLLEQHLQLLQQHDQLAQQLQSQLKQQQELSFQERQQHQALAQQLQAQLDDWQRHEAEQLQLQQQQRQKHEEELRLCREEKLPPVCCTVSIQVDEVADDAPAAAAAAGVEPHEAAPDAEEEEEAVPLVTDRRSSASSQKRRTVGTRTLVEGLVPKGEPTLRLTKVRPPTASTVMWQCLALGLTIGLLLGACLTLAVSQGL